MKRFKIEFFKRLLYCIATMSALLIILGLYVPMKRFFSGDEVTIGEIVTSIRYLHYLPYILVGSIALAYWGGTIKAKKSNE